MDIITSTIGSSIQVWENHDGKFVCATEVGQLRSCIPKISFFAVSPDGKYICVACEKYCQLSRISGTDTTHTIYDNFSYPITCVAVSNNSVAMATEGGDIFLHNIKFSRSNLKNNLQPIRSLSFSPSGTYLASVTGNGTILIWNISDGTEYELYNSSVKQTIFYGSTLSPMSLCVDGYEPARCVNWSPTEDHIVVGTSYGNSYVLDVKSGKKITSLIRFDGCIKSIIYSPD